MAIVCLKDGIDVTFCRREFAMPEAFVGVALVVAVASLGEGFLLGLELVDAWGLAVREQLFQLLSGLVARLEFSIVLQIERPAILCGAIFVPSVTV